MVNEATALADECERLASYSIVDMPLYNAQTALKKAAALLRASPQPSDVREQCAKIAERGICQTKCASPDCLTARRIAGEIRASGDKR